MAKRVSRNSRISRSWDAWIHEKLVLKMLDLDSVMSPMSPASGLQPPRNCHKIGMIPGSSTVEHSAVNRNVGGSNPPRGAKFLSFSHLQTRLFLLRSECHNSLRVFEAKDDKHFAKTQCFRRKNNCKCAD